MILSVEYLFSMISKQSSGCLFMMETMTSSKCESVSHIESKNMCIMYVCSDLTQTTITNFLLYLEHQHVPFTLHSIFIPHVPLRASQFENLCSKPGWPGG